ncbi:MAG TPA: creatininase family protein, partial [Longimicrobiales bacterium]|nr:creatininase family protein [Longimicrobiales bacterium]
MRIKDMTWMQVDEYLKHDDRCVLPLGSTEQHAYLSLAVDAILAEKVAADAAEPLGVPVFPVMAYGITPYFMAYPGTGTLTPGTYERVVAEILAGVTKH